MMALALPARAAFVDDPPFAHGPLDLKRLQADKHDAGAPIDLSIQTYGRWRARLLDVDGPNRISVLFNTDRTEGQTSPGRSSSAMAPCGCGWNGAMGHSCACSASITPPGPASG
jgi:hypothetical protein